MRHYDKFQGSGIVDTNNLTCDSLELCYWSSACKDVDPKNLVNFQVNLTDTDMQHFKIFKAFNTSKEKLTMDDLVNKRCILKIFYHEINDYDFYVGQDFMEEHYVSFNMEPYYQNVTN